MVNPLQHSSMCEVTCPARRSGMCYVSTGFYWAAIGFVGDEKLLLARDRLVVRFLRYKECAERQFNGGSLSSAPHRLVVVVARVSGVSGLGWGPDTFRLHECRSSSRHCLGLFFRIAFRFGLAQNHSACHITGQIPHGYCIIDLWLSLKSP